MNTFPTAIKVATILFDNTDTKVLIKGETIKNHLSYPSEMFISFSELNVLMNDLQKKNPDIQVCELFQEESLGNDYQQTFLDASALENSLIDFSFFSFGSAKKLIRA